MYTDSRVPLWSDTDWLQIWPVRYWLKKKVIWRTVYRGYSFCLFRKYICVCVCKLFLRKKIVPLFSGTIRPTKLKLGTHMDNVWMYLVYQNQAVPAYSLLYFFIFLSLQFSDIKSFRHTFIRNCEAQKIEIHTWTLGRCIVYTRIGLLLLICPFISSFLFLSNFQTLKFLSHFSQELWGPEGWNLLHTWTVGRCFVYTGIWLLLLFVPLFLQFSFSSVFKL